MEKDPRDKKINNDIWALKLPPLVIKFAIRDLRSRKMMKCLFRLIYFRGFYRKGEKRVWVQTADLEARNNHRSVDNQSDGLDEVSETNRMVPAVG